MVFRVVASNNIMGFRDTFVIDNPNNIRSFNQRNDQLNTSNENRAYAARIHRALSYHSDYHGQSTITLPSFDPVGEQW
jgi:hypothetical protein